MSGCPVTGAVPVARCHWCRDIVVPCTAPACVGHGAVRLRSRKHACRDGLTLAFPARVRSFLGGAG